LLFIAVNTSLIAGFGQSVSAGRSRLSMTDSDQDSYQRFVQEQIDPYNLVPASYYQDLIRSTTQQTARRTEAWQTRLEKSRCTISTLALFKRKSENADFINFSKLADAYQQATTLTQTPSPFTPFTTRNASTYDRSAQQDQLQVAQSKQAIEEIFLAFGIANPDLYNKIGELDTQLRGILEPFFDPRFVTVSDLILQNIPLLEGSPDKAGSIITVPRGDCLKRYYPDADLVSLAQNRRRALATADTLITQAAKEYPQIAPIWRGYLCDAYELFLSSGITILATRMAAYELIETIRELQTTCKTTLIGFLRRLKSITQQQQTTYTSAVKDKLMSAAPPFTAAANHQLITLIPQWTTQSPDLKNALDALSKTAEQKTKDRLELIAALTAEIPDIHDAPEITQLKTELGRLHRVFAAANKQVYNHAALCAALVPPAPRSARTDVVWTNGAAEGGVSDDDGTELSSKSRLVAFDETGDDLSGDENPGSSPDEGSSDDLPTPRKGGAWSGGQRTDSGARINPTLEKQLRVQVATPGKGGDICPICFKQFLPGEEVWVCTRCNKIFGHDKTTCYKTIPRQCPLCRADTSLLARWTIPTVDAKPQRGITISRTGIYSLKEPRNGATSVSLKDSDDKPIQDAQALYYSHRLKKYKVVRADDPDHTYLEDTSDERQKTDRTLELRFTSNTMTLQAADGESLI
jgi:hypothetical protein